MIMLIYNGRAMVYRKNREVSVKVDDAELKSYIRDINLKLITDKYSIKYDTSKSRSRFQFFKKNWDLINYVTKLGGVLTGSRALKCCSINNVFILDREAYDFDFIITKKMAFDICLKFNYAYNLTDSIITIKKQRWTSYNAYNSNNDKRYGYVDVDLLIVDELPEFIEMNGIRITSFTYIINEKLKMITKKMDKHSTDLCNISMKFNLL
jgi:hypothetical protein